MNACKDRKFPAIDFKIKSIAGGIQILFTITIDRKIFLGCFHQVIEFW